MVYAKVCYCGAIAFYSFVLVNPIGFEGFSKVVYIGIQQQRSMVQYAFLLLEDVSSSCAIGLSFPYPTALILSLSTPKLSKISFTLFALS